MLKPVLAARGCGRQTVAANGGGRHAACPSPIVISLPGKNRRNSIVLHEEWEKKLDVKQCIKFNIIR